MEGHKGDFPGDKNLHLDLGVGYAFVKTYEQYT